MNDAIKSNDGNICRCNKTYQWRGKKFVDIVDMFCDSISSIEYDVFLSDERRGIIIYFKDTAYPLCVDIETNSQKYVCGLRKLNDDETELSDVEQCFQNMYYYYTLGKLATNTIIIRVLKEQALGDRANYGINL